MNDQTTNRCTCGKPTRDQAYVCDDCLGELSKALGDIPWVDEQLDITLTRQRAAGGAGSPSSEKPMPFHLGAFVASRRLRHVLTKWIKFCEEEHIRHSSPVDGLPDDTAPGQPPSLVAMSRWLMWRVDGLALNDLGGDTVTEITGAVDRAMHTIDRPAERRYSGPCECGRDLYHKPGAKLAKCKACEREYNVEELVEWMRAGVLGRLVTAREGATLLSRFDLETNQQTIDKWHARKRLVDHGNDAKGRRIYLIDDLLTLAAQNTNTRSA